MAHKPTSTLWSRLARPGLLRGLLALVIVTGYVVYPWAASGPVAYDSSDPRLVYVTQTYDGSVLFNQGMKRVEITASQMGGPRLDFVTSESSFQFTTDAVVIRQAPFQGEDWHWVSATAHRLLRGNSFKVTMQAGNSTVMDVASVKVTDGNDPAILFFQSNISESDTSEWTLKGNASFVTAGNPPLPAIHLVPHSGKGQPAQTSSFYSVSSDTTSVTVSALVRFQGQGRQFKIGTDWFRSDGTYVVSTTDWRTWVPNVDMPAALVFSIWYPLSAHEVHIRFKPLDLASGQVFFEILDQAQVLYNRTIAQYAVGERFLLEASWERLEAIGFTLSNNTENLFEWTSDTGTRGYLGDLVSQSQMNFSVFLQSVRSDSQAVLSNPVYFFPGSGRFADFATTAVPFVASLAVLAVLLALWSKEETRIARGLLLRLRNPLGGRMLSVVRRHWMAVAFLLFAGSFYLVLATSFGGHPFDNIVFKTWAYAGQDGAPRDIYGRTSSVGDAFMRDYRPWNSVGFAYPPLAAYLFLLLSRLILPFNSFPTQDAMFGSALVEGQIKWLLAFFTLLAGAILYKVVYDGTGSRRRALAAMALLVLNPAVVFDSAVWGETDSVMYLAFLVFGWAASKRPGLAATVLLLTLAFKQTGVILIIPIALVSMSNQRNLGTAVSSLGKAASVLFACLVPIFAAGLLPSTLIKPFITKLADIGTPAGFGTPLVSADTYTLWTMFTGVGYPSNAPVVAGLSFGLLGFLAFMLLLAYVLARSRSRLSKAAPVAYWYGATAFGTVVFVTLVTGAASRYYTLAIPPLIGLLALGWDRLSPQQKKMTIGATVLVSLISFWTMVGLLSWIMLGDFPSIHGLELAHNAFTLFVSQYYLNFVVVVVGSIGAVVALVLTTRLVISLGRVMRETEKVSGGHESVPPPTVRL